MVIAMVLCVLFWVVVYALVGAMMTAKILSFAGVLIVCYLILMERGAK